MDSIFYFKKSLISFNIVDFYLFDDSKLHCFQNIFNIFNQIRYIALNLIICSHIKVYYKYKTDI